MRLLQKNNTHFFINYFLSYQYFVILGIKKIEKIPSPKTRRIFAPGQCIILNKIPSAINEQENAPEINANVFIFI